jgi:glycosyltransferase involved in cell wall biosynthesis
VSTRSTSTSRTRVLVVSHEASRTGAPRIAFLVAQSLVQHGDEVRVVLRRPGPLEGEFAGVAPTRVEPWYRVRRRLWRISGCRILALAVDTAFAAATIIRARPHVVYLNSTASVVYARPAIWLRRHVVVHSHESATVASCFIRPARADRLLSRSTLVACSSSVQHALAEVAGVDVSSIVLVPSVPDAAVVRSLAEGPLPQEFSPDDIVVGCCGSVEHRKGADLWLEAARRVRAALPDCSVRFLWIGTVDDPELVASAPPGVFVGPSANPYPYMARFDIATLPSRDDPFPLVVLESMALGKPVVAFAVGAVRDQVGPGGILVEPGDVEAFADAIIELLTDDQLRRELGRLARARVESMYSIERFRAAVVATVTR